VFKRYTDYTTIEGIKNLASKIAAERTKARDHARFGQSDVKLGRGGIREIEFIVQSLAVTHGGRDPTLQTPATRGLLSLLAQSQRIDLEIAKRLDAAYVFFVAESNMLSNLKRINKLTLFPQRIRSAGNWHRF